jgi:ubiquinone/menaquinone biosynthesis C-methylase UbiE
MASKSNNEFTIISKKYDIGRQGENFDFWAKETKKLGELKEDSLILDLGCGTGLYTKAIKDVTNATLCGFDPAIGMLKQAKEKDSTIHWFNAIGDKIPLRSNLFDCIFSSQVWHHIIEKQATAGENNRVLKKGGTLIIRTISHIQLRKKIVFKFFPEIMENQLRVYPSNEDFSTYFTNAGFKSTTHKEYQIERYQTVESFVKIAEEKLWSMFRPISDMGLKKGISMLWKYHKENDGTPIKNDELITLVISKK